MRRTVGADIKKQQGRLRIESDDLGSSLTTYYRRPCNPIMKNKLSKAGWFHPSDRVVPTGRFISDAFHQKKYFTLSSTL